jgi:ABC-type Zn uptake system ZnuABC Zn-binding protein ZnuA
MRNFKEWLEQLLTKIPERAEFISENSLSYWLRRDKQRKLDRRGLTEEA